MHYNRLRLSLTKDGALAGLVYINIAVFIFVGVYNAIFYLVTDHTPLFFDKMLALSSDPVTVVKHPWTIITYMFYHLDFLHALFNLLVLYWFGVIFVDFFGNLKLTTMYVAGGITGGLFYLLAYNSLPVFYDEGTSILLGASAAIMAITFGSASFSPNHKIWLMFIGDVRLKYLAFAYLIIDLIQIPFGNAGGHIAHLGGAFVGALWGYTYRKNGKNILGWLESLLNSIKKISFKRKTLKVAYKNPQMQPKKKQNNKELDELLDKISQKGLDSLTEAEKQKLFKYKNDLNS
jgi:membrane associated rhomboid family serine protease